MSFMNKVVTTSAKRVLRSGVIAMAMAAALACGRASAGIVDLGFVSYDVTSSTAAQFDIINVTGPNEAALGDPDFPVTNTVDFSALSLTVDFSNGTTHSYGSSYFTTSLDGISFDGTAIPFGGTNPNITGAQLTGDFSTSLFNLAGGGTFTASSLAFSANITDSAGSLADGDAALITASSGVTPVPEPASWAVLMAGVAVLAFVGYRRRLIGAGVVVLTLAASALAPAVAAPVGLSTAASPSSGTAGFSYENLIAHNLPGVAAGSITVTLAPTCAAGATGPVAGQVTTAAKSVLSLPGGVGERIQFLIPSSANQQTYFVSVSGSGFASTGCSVLAVSNSGKSLKACLPTSSLAVALGSGVTAYVPNGAWAYGTTGINVVHVEGGGAPVTLATANPVNSCSSNPATGQTVCTANNTDVYLLTGTSLTNTLTSGSTGSVDYSGGTCQNCGVAVNALTNTAYIAEGSNTAPPDSASQLQALNLSTNAFLAPFVTNFELSEDISVDPTRNLVLSPSYGTSFGDPRYQLYTLDAGGNVLSEFTNQAYSYGNYPDSSAEDCSTGIALSSDEDNVAVFLANLNNATFSGGTWTAPGQLQQLVNTTSFSAGICGIAIAPGVTHLGVISGEFGGNTFGAIQLPASAGSGVPSLTDYASGYLPSTPDGYPFSAGYDPHTVTAYTSPVNGRAYAIIADWYLGTPSYLAVIDLAKALAATRTTATAIIDPSVDVIATGIVRYVSVH